MLVLENHYRNVSNQLKQDITNLWRREGVLREDHKIEQRLGQVVYVVRDSASGTLAGVSTAEKKKVKELNNHYFYEFRCFISEAHRVAGLDIKISKLTIDCLQEISSRDPEKPIGVFSILENDSLKEHPVWRRAVWPETQMYFVGYTKTGNPIRVHYFKGARV